MNRESREDFGKIGEQCPPYRHRDVGRAMPGAFCAAFKREPIKKLRLRGK